MVLSRALTESRREAVGYKAAFEERGARVVELHAENATLRQEVERLEAKVKLVLGSTPLEVNLLRRQVEELKAEAAACCEGPGSRLEELERQVEEQAAKLEYIKADVAQAVAETKQAESALAASKGREEGKQMVIAQLEAERDDWRHRYEVAHGAADAKLDAAQAEVTRLEAALRITHAAYHGGFECPGENECFVARALTPPLTTPPPQSPRRAE